MTRMELAVAREASRAIAQTPEQARLRVLEARIGSLADATDDYLSALRTEVQTWLAVIDRELSSRIGAGREGMP